MLRSMLLLPAAILMLSAQAVAQAAPATFDPPDGTSVPAGSNITVKNNRSVAAVMTLEDENGNVVGGPVGLPPAGPTGEETIQVPNNPALIGRTIKLRVSYLDGTPDDVASFPVTGSS